jgi:hypothetical protein
LNAEVEDGCIGDCSFSLSPIQLLRMDPLRQRLSTFHPSPDIPSRQNHTPADAVQRWPSVNSDQPLGMECDFGDESIAPALTSGLF